MVKKLLTRVVDALPESARFQVRERYWRVKSRFLYQSIYSRLNLEHTLNSGLTLKVASKGEWWAYNEIFVNGEYDVPTQTALENSSAKPFVVLDLGANVGYFAFRVFDLIAPVFLQGFQQHFLGVVMLGKRARCTNNSHVLFSLSKVRANCIARYHGIVS